MTNTPTTRPAGVPPVAHRPRVSKHAASPLAMCAAPGGPPPPMDLFYAVLIAAALAGVMLGVAQ